MSTEGKHWSRSDKKWSPDIDAWVRSICPIREHGFNSRQELCDEINRRFGREFSVKALAAHTYENDILLGLENKQLKHKGGNVARPVGSFQCKKGYLRIKVAQPNVWMQYQRYVWEQAHPGENGEGKRFIFMDGNRRNFDVDNIECITPSEQSIMAELGCKQSSTREEREIFLLRARLMIAKSQLYGGGDKNAHRHNKLAYERKKRSAEYIAHRKEYAKRHNEEVSSDPEKRAKRIEKQRAYRASHKEQVRKTRLAYIAKNRDHIREVQKRYRERKKLERQQQEEERINQ